MLGCAHVYFPKTFIGICRSQGLIRDMALQAAIFLLEGLEAPRFADRKVPVPIQLDLPGHTVPTQDFCWGLLAACS